MRNWRPASIRRTSGSCSAPASGSATSRPKASSPRIWRSTLRARRWNTPARCPGDRPDRAGDLDAGQHLSGDRGRGAERARHPSWRRLRSAGGVLRLRVCAGDRRQFPARRRLQARAGDWRRDVLADSRLERPRHLRAVRRWRRRGRARGAGPAGQIVRPRRADDASAFGRPAQGEALCRRRSVHHPDRWPSTDGRPRSVQACGRHDHRRDRRCLQCDRR